MLRPGWTVLPIAALLVQVLLASCSFERAARRESRAHQGHGACVTCHRTADPSSGGPSQAFAGDIEPSLACLDCHHYDDANHHPVNIAPREGSAAASQTVLPLVDGQIRCLTCHQAHRDPGQNKLNGPPMLLRGGPYADQRTLCFRCHGPDEYTQIDPHVMLAPDGRVREVNGRPVCLLCHTKLPDPAGDPELVEFRTDVAFLCWRCHAPMAGSFLKNHSHVKPKKPVRAMLLNTKDRFGVELPLARDGRITCSTCHNPHQAGVIIRAAVQAGADDPQRLRIDAPSLCAACHAK